MMRTPTIFLVVIAIALLCLPANVEAAEGWGVKATPSYVLSGETLNITVTGTPNIYAVVVLRSPNGTSAQEMMGKLDEFGRLDAFFGIPIDTPSGIYRVEVVAHIAGEAVLVANATVEVLKDDINWLNDRINQLGLDLEEAKRVLFPLRRDVNALEDEISDRALRELVEIAALIVLIAIVAILYRPWVEWKAVRARGQGPMGRAVRSALHPPLETEFEHLDGVESNRYELVKEQMSALGMTVGEEGLEAPPAPRKGLRHRLAERKERKLLHKQHVAAEKAERKAAKFKRPVRYGRKEVEREMVAVEEDPLEQVIAPEPPSPPPRPVPKGNSPLAQAQSLAKQRPQPVVPKSGPELPRVVADEEQDVVEKMLAEYDKVSVQPPRSLYRIQSKASSQVHVRNGRKGAGSL